MAIERYNVAPIVRLPSADPYLARRLLDLGALGFIVPVVESAPVFSDFLSHCLYPPKGRRGVGLSRANVWGEDFDDYFSGFEPVLIPQIETKKGAENVAEIVALDCVDGLFIGPYDLSADLDKPGDFESLEYNNARGVIRDACIDHGKLAGIHQVAPNIDELMIRRQEGYKFIAFGTDLIAMRYAFQKLTKT